MFKTLDPATRRLYFLLVAGFVMFGVIFTVAGAALPHIIKTFGWSYTVTGIVLAASSAGYFLASFLNGFLVQKVSPKIIIVIGLLIGAACAGMFARWPSPWLNLLLNFGIGLCQGSIEVVTNLEVIHMEKKGQSRLMNLIHAMFCVGAIVGPAAVGYILNAQIPLVTIFVASSVLFGLLAVFFVITPFPRVRAEAEPGTSAGLRLLRQPLLLIMTGALLVYVGTEIGISSWASEYVVKVLRSRHPPERLPWHCSGRGCWPAGWRSPSATGDEAGAADARPVHTLRRWPSLRSCWVGRRRPSRRQFSSPASGSSGFYPLGISLVGKYFKSGVAVGTVATGGAAGSITFPFMMAMLSQGMGIRRGFRLYLGLNVVLVILSLALVRIVRRGPQPRGAARGSVIPFSEVHR